MFVFILKASYLVFTVLSMYYVVLYNKMAEDIAYIKKTLAAKKK